MSDAKETQAQARQSIDSAVWDVCDILRRSNCASAIQYVPEVTWILFLRILDERERQEADQAAAVGDTFTPSLDSPYRWRDWAAPSPKTNGNAKVVGTLRVPSALTRRVSEGNPLPAPTPCPRRQKGSSSRSPSAT
jgi:hypothetical protein